MVERMLELTVVEQDADRLALAHQLLQLRKRGKSYYERSRQMMMTVASLKAIESECRDKVFQTIAADIEEERNLRIAQLNQVIGDARSIAENAYEYSEKLSALNVITKAIQAAAKITGLEPAPARITNNLNVINEQELLGHLAVLRGLDNGNGQ
jgi:hypothetical protein